MQCKVWIVFDQTLPDREMRADQAESAAADYGQIQNHGKKQLSDLYVGVVTNHTCKLWLVQLPPTLGVSMLNNRLTGHVKIISGGRRWHAHTA